jgi:hypothetical protein
MGHEPQCTPINHTTLNGLRRKGDVADFARILPTGQLLLTPETEDGQRQKSRQQS